MRRCSSLLLLLVLGATLAACGDDADSGGDPRTAYVQTWDRGCRDLKAAQQEFIAAIRRGATGTTPTTTTTVPRAVQEPVLALAERRERVLRTLRGARAPEEFAAFQREMATAIDAGLRQIDQIRDRVTSGAVGGTAETPVRFPELPNELAAEAESCQGGGGL